jgi:hypothetical protein
MNASRPRVRTLRSGPEFVDEGTSRTIFCIDDAEYLGHLTCDGEGAKPLGSRNFTMFVPVQKKKRPHGEENGVSDGCF